MKTAALLFITLLLQMPWAAQAQAQKQTSTQDVWRCGVDGRSYSTTPCSDGRVLTTTEARPAADVSAAQQLAQHEALLAAQLRRAHLQDDARRVGNGYGMLSAPKAAPVAVSPAAAQLVGKTRRTVHHRLAADGTSPAVVPASRRMPG